jgi:hypothetical protein
MSRLPRILLTLGLAALVLGATTSNASAQSYGQPAGYGYPPPPPPPRLYRQGLVFGLGIGLGAFSADNCGDACGAGIAFEGHIGGMLTPQLALMFDAFPVIHTVNSDTTTTNTAYTVAAQVFLNDLVWLKGGVGFAHFTESSDAFGDLTDTGTALLVGAGIEVYQAGPFAIDLQLRLEHSFYSTAKDMNEGAFLVGFNWY